VRSIRLHKHFTWQVNVRKIIAAWRVRQHWPWDLLGALALSRGLPQLHFQFGVYFYLAACNLDLLFPRLIATLLHRELMLTCCNTHN
jgi:hypothetical protein